MRKKDRIYGNVSCNVQKIYFQILYYGINNAKMSFQILLWDE